MLINLIGSQFTETGGIYYSPAFLQDSVDEIVTVGM